MALKNSNVLPEYISTRQAVIILNHPKHKRKNLYKIRLELKGIWKGAGKKKIIFPIDEILKKREELIINK